MSNGTLEWSGATPSHRSPRLCTWALRWPALEPTLTRQFGASKLRPGRCWRCQWGVCGWGMRGQMHDATGLCGAQLHSGAVRRRRTVPGSVVFVLGSFSSWHWSAFQTIYLVLLNGPPGGFGVPIEWERPQESECCMDHLRHTALITRAMHAMHLRCIA